jgi:hypothetical protein
MIGSPLHGSDWTAPLQYQDPERFAPAARQQMQQHAAPPNRLEPQEHMDGDT